MPYLPQYQHINVFAQACSLLKPTFICDIGSYDGSDARILADTCPQSAIIAFEANPENFFDLSLAPAMMASRLSVQHLAIADKDGITEIMLPGPIDNADDHVKHLLGGMGSLLSRPDLPKGRSYPVSSRRLDSFFGPRIEASTFALWVDVEGNTKPLIEGARDVLSKTLLVKLELETVEYWKGQTLAPEIIAIMADAGFSLLATSDPSVTQMDALFLHKNADSALGARLIEDALRTA